MFEYAPVTIDDIKQYRLMRTPDMASLSRYILLAKGPERTMAQFADDVGISASTLSRIVNHNFKKALSIDTIINIYEHRANLEDTALLEHLARANGYLSPKEVHRIAEQDIPSMSNELLNRELMMKNSIISSVVACGLPIEKVYPLRFSDATIKIPTGRTDFVIKTDSDKKNSPISYWSFFLFPRRAKEGVYSVIDDRSSTIEAQMIVNRRSSLFLLDAWTPDIFKKSKFSFVFIDEQIFNAVNQLLSISKLNTEMTLILLNETNYTVVKEVWLSGNYTQSSNVSIFDYPAPSNEEEEEDPYNHQEYNTEDTE